MRQFTAMGMNEDQANCLVDNLDMEEVVANGAERSVDVPRPVRDLRHRSGRSATPAAESMRTTSTTSRPRFDAVLFDAGGVLVLPDPTVLGPLLAPLGGDPSIDVHRRAHYYAMANKSRAIVGEADWHEYDLAYVESIGVAVDDREHAAVVLGRTRTRSCGGGRSPSRWTALAELAAAGVPMGVVSNASGQIEMQLAPQRRVPGRRRNRPRPCGASSTAMSSVSPSPIRASSSTPCRRFPGIAPERIVYVGDSVTMDIGGARRGRTAPDPDRSVRRPCRRRLRAHPIGPRVAGDAHGLSWGDSTSLTRRPARAGGRSP